MSADIVRYPSVHQDFNEVLIEQIHRTPWILISGAIHVLVVIILMLFMQTEVAVASNDFAGVTIEEDLPDLETIGSEEPPEVEPEVPTEDVENDVVTDSNDDLNESDDNQDYEETTGDSDFDNLSKLTSDSNNDAIGVGGGIGGGRGQGGRRRRLRGHGSKKLRVVMKGLDWLARHQAPNGSWDADGFYCQDGGCHCLEESRGGALYDVGVTGLSLLAFLGAGESPRNGVYKDNLRKGLRWLMTQQDAEGCFAARTTANYSYNQAIATLAMIEAYDMVRMPSLKSSAEKGFNFCMSMQNPYKAWRYKSGDGQNDMSVTGWMAMVMKAAKGAGFTVDQTRVGWTQDFVAEMTSEETGRVGYRRAGEITVRERGKVEEFPGTESEAMTAAGVCCRIFLGEDPANSREIKLAVDNILVKKLPLWDVARGSIDMYYWYYGTLALFQVGGDAYRQWNRAMTEAILDHQRTDGNFSGSWDPKGAWGESGGRVYSTALMTMCLEVYYRYGRVFGTK